MESVVLLVVGAAILGYMLGMTLGILAAILAAWPIGDPLAWMTTGIFGIVGAAVGSYLAMAYRLPGRELRIALILVGAALLLAYALTVDEVETFTPT